ncbi:vomeronasal type-2 receptor 26-like [Aquarana catesbeiana]|uniref:vomeronasal type-2 receptor 26-like n=1 Tax=Aquarana catesbeiana TaxID=8400 RepID=UPI003CCA3BEA
MFAIEEINNRTDLLPNITLGYQIYDVCNIESKAIQSVLDVLSGMKNPVPNYDCHKKSKKVMFVGHKMTSPSVASATLTGVYGYPQISYGAMDSVFINKFRFTSFYRTVPDERHQFNAIILLLKHFGWNWVGIVSSQDNESERVITELNSLLMQNEICVAFAITINGHIAPYHNLKTMYRILQATSSVIIIYGTAESTYLSDVIHFTSKERNIFILFGTFQIYVNLKTGITLNGSLMVSLHSGNIPGLKDYLLNVNPEKYPDNPMLLNVWRQQFSCVPESLLNFSEFTEFPCGESHSFQSVDLFEYDVESFCFSFNVYAAVYTLAHALHDTYLYKEGNVFKSEISNWQMWQIIRYLRRVHIITKGGEEIQFNEGKVSPRFDLINIIFTPNKSFSMVKVGYFHYDAEEFKLKINRKMIQWHPRFSKKHKETGDVEDRRCSGWPKKLNAADERHIMITSLQHRKMFSSAISTEQAETSGIQIHPPTVRRSLARSGVHGRIMVKRPYLRYGNSCQGSGTPHFLCSESCLPGYQKLLQEGRQPCCHYCVPCPENEITDKYDMERCYKCAEDKWPNERRDTCIQKTTEFLSYGDTVGLSLIFISVILCFVTIIIFGIFVKYKDTPIVKVNNKTLSFILLLSLILSFLCPLLFIGHPTKVSCLLQQAVIGMTFSVAISSMLAKTVTVILAFKATRPNSMQKKWLGKHFSTSILIICSVGEGMICVFWLIFFPPFPEYNTQVMVGKIILQCNEGSVTAFYIMIGYIGGLAVISFIVAFLARKLPDMFNEAQYITFSMLVVSSVWLSFIPAYLSTKGKYMVAVEVFAILSSSAGVLGCIFIPKCYIILLRSEMNVKTSVTQRNVFN